MMGLCENFHTLLGPPRGSPEEKVEPGAWGLHEFAYGSGSGSDSDSLRLCTESLGSESCECGMAADEVAQMEISAEDEKSRKKARSEPRRTEKREFPLPLRWLAGSRFLKAERRDGRLILTEEQNGPAEFFHAHRGDGRLQLHMIESHGPDKAEAEKAAPSETQEEREAKGERRGGEGFRRCQEAMAGGNAGVPLWWNHRFVMTV